MYLTFVQASRATLRLVECGLFFLTAQVFLTKQKSIEGEKWTTRAKTSLIDRFIFPDMKKIEAIIDPAALDAVKLHLAEAGIDGRLTVTEVSGLEDLGRFYQIGTTGQSPWKPCLRIDLIVSDRQTQATVNIILQHAKLAGQAGTGGHINILSLDVLSTDQR